MTYEEQRAAWFNQMKEEMRKAGYRVSEGGSWIDPEIDGAYVSSIESVPNTWGHPVAIAQWMEGQTQRNF